jgi:hypothetical protein
MIKLWVNLHWITKWGVMCIPVDTREVALLNGEWCVYLLIQERLLEQDSKATRQDLHEQQVGDWLLYYKHARAINDNSLFFCKYSMYLVVWDERWILEGNMKLTSTQYRTRGINLIDD